MEKTQEMFYLVCLENKLKTDLFRVYNDLYIYSILIFYVIFFKSFLRNNSSYFIFYNQKNF